MAGTLTAMLDYFTPENDNLDSLALWQLRAFVGITGTSAILLLAMWLTVLLGFSEDKTPCHILAGIHLLALILIKYTGNKTIVVNFMLFSIISIVCIQTPYTGQIYSYHLRWLTFPLLLSSLFLEIKYSIGWMVIILGVITYFYLNSVPLDWEISKASSLDYFLDNFFFILSLGTLILLFYYSQKRMNNELNKKNQLLQQQQLTLEQKTNELNILTKKLRNSNEQLETYAHITAHDLNQPVNTISSFAKLVQTDLESDNISKHTFTYLDFITKSSKRLSDMIRNLLAFAKVDFDQNQQKEEFQLSESLNNIILELDSQIKKSKVDVRFGELPKIEGNKIQIECLFQNLISNAVKFSRHNVDSLIEISHIDKNSKHQFKVFDNGIGIEEEIIDQVFEAFEQVNEKKYSGIGVGLSICQKIVESHGGKIWVESEFGESTEFYFTISK